VAIEKEYTQRQNKTQPNLPSTASNVNLNEIIPNAKLKSPRK
jgi:hypothetical protein